MKKSPNLQNFLLTFFEGDFYQDKEVNGFMLVKQFNGDTKRWQVAVFTKESLERSRTQLGDNLFQDYKNRLDADNT